MTRAYKLLPKVILLCSCLLIGTTCSPRQFDREMESRYSDPFDKDINLNRGDIREFMRPGKGKDKVDSKGGDRTNDVKAGEEVVNPEFSSLSDSENLAPPFSPVLLAPDAPEIQGKKRITLTITEGIELKDVFMEIARLAELELALDPNIKGGVILSVNNRPIGEVLDMLSDMAGLRYTIEHGILRVVEDTSYIVNYSVDYLNLTRSSSGSINTQTQVLSSGSNGGAGGSGGNGGGGNSGGSNSGSSGSGLNSGSSNSITTSYNGDLWGSIETNLKSILATTLATLDTEEGSAIATPLGRNLEAAKLPAADASGDSGLMSQAMNQVVNAAGGKGGSGAAGGKGGGGMAGGKGGGAGGGTADSAQISPSTYYSINRQAGIITVMANSRKHAAVKEYLDKVRNSMSAQVLIEAKVVEVQLDEQFASGIDWSGFSILNNLVLDGKYGTNIDKVSQDNLFSNSGVTTDSITLLGRHQPPGQNKITSVLKLIQGFGITRTLQNPRLTVLNNQQAVLSFAKNQTYYTVTGSLQQTSTTTPSGGTSNPLPVTVNSTLHTIPIGVILSMQPSIDIDTQEITLHVRPTLSVIADKGQPDPAVTLLASSIASLSPDSVKALNNNTVPIVQVREIDTILKIKSGEVMVIGGLIQHDDSNIEQGLPFASRIPFFGNLVRNNQITNSATETIILIQATIVTPNGYYHKHDKKLYEGFTNDPRPLVF